MDSLIEDFGNWRLMDTYGRDPAATGRAPKDDSSPIVYLYGSLNAIKKKGQDVSPETLAKQLEISLVHELVHAAEFTWKKYIEPLDSFDIMGGAIIAFEIKVHTATFLLCGDISYYEGWMGAVQKFLPNVMVIDLPALGGLAYLIEVLSCFICRCRSL